MGKPNPKWLWKSQLLNLKNNLFYRTLNKNTNKHNYLLVKYKLIVKIHLTPKLNITKLKSDFSPSHLH